MHGILDRVCGVELPLDLLQDAAILLSGATPGILVGTTKVTESVTEPVI